MACFARAADSAPLSSLNGCGNRHPALACRIWQSTDIAAVLPLNYAREFALENQVFTALLGSITVRCVLQIVLNRSDPRGRTDITLIIGAQSSASTAVEFGGSGNLGFELALRSVRSISFKQFPGRNTSSITRLAEFRAC